MPQSDMKTVERFALAGRSGKALTNVAHEIKDDQGGVESAGSTDGGGASSQTIGKTIAPVRMKIKVPEAAVEPSDEPSHQDVNGEDEEDEYQFVAISEDGSPVDLAYRIDGDGEKLHEGRLDPNGQTVVLPMSRSGEPTFWIPK
jgi:hypothetical protein